MFIPSPRSSLSFLLLQPHFSTFLPFFLSSTLFSFRVHSFSSLLPFIPLTSAKFSTFLTYFSSLLSYSLFVFIPHPLFSFSFLLLQPNSLLSSHIFPLFGLILFSCSFLLHSPPFHSSVFSLHSFSYFPSYLLLFYCSFYYFLYFFILSVATCYVELFHSCRSPVFLLVENKKRRLITFVGLFSRPASLCP